MNKDSIYFKTNLIPIFNSKGQKLDEVVLPQVVTPVPRRRCCISNNNTFYKGAGIIYIGHFVNDYSSPLQLLDKTEALYEKYHALTKQYGNMYLLGRLAEYKYYNIDAMTKKALELADRLLAQ
mgnify:CR=1 FL=1